MKIVAGEACAIADDAKKSVKDFGELVDREVHRMNEAARRKKKARKKDSAHYGWRIQPPRSAKHKGPETKRWQRKR
jgi:hypothetical protein